MWPEEETHRGVHKERHESLFFTASFKERKCFYNLHEGFFLTVCTHSYKLKCTVSYREKEQKPKASFPTATPSIPRLSATCPSWEPRRQPAQACKWFIFKMYISGTFNKMRGNGFINNVVFFFFLGNPILVGFHRLGHAQDVMGLVVQVWHLLRLFLLTSIFWFFNSQHTII